MDFLEWKDWIAIVAMVIFMLLYSTSAYLQQKTASKIYFYLSQLSFLAWVIYSAIVGF
ncbi:hypothetical protein [Candidatus Albibeggiatoa sp. nov. NOAA]|uniref:hypothetical protein n=1 Tax=Candidatus Albibeggiatoa sp. nov. NOAA TaxID=3162724 RepID=UPI0033405CFB